MVSTRAKCKHARFLLDRYTLFLPIHFSWFVCQVPFDQRGGIPHPPVVVFPGWIVCNFQNFFQGDNSYM
jgi:hypothetical protein